MWIVLIGMIVAPTLALLPFEQSLLDKSTRFAHASDSQEETYYWLSNRKALFLRYVPKSNHFQAVQVDSDGGKETLLTAFNTKFSARMPATLMHMHYGDGPGAPSEIVHLPPNSALSPDGQWLLWPGGRQGWITATLDGSRQVLGPKWVQAYALWMPDSRRWVELQQVYRNDAYKFTYAVIHSLDHPQGVRKVRISSLADGMVAGISRSSQVVVHTDDRQQEASSHADFAEIGLDSKAASARKYRIRLPHEARLWEVVMSPQGDRLAWLLSRNRESKGLPDMYSLWVSDLKGGHMREIGHVEAQSEKTTSSPTGDRTHAPQTVRWTPGGKRLSFLYKDALYTVPVG